MADHALESDALYGLSPCYPYIDEATRELAYAAATWDRIQRLRVALSNSKMASDRALASLVGAEQTERRGVERALKAHVLWPFLEPLKGLRSANVGRVIGMIRDPRRFPGQRCEQGHHLPAVFEVGAPCPLRLCAYPKCLRLVPSEYCSRHQGAKHREAVDEGNEIVEADGALPDPSDVPQEADVRVEIESLNGPCGALVGSERRGTGVRSVWHYFGQDVMADGRARRKVKGQKATYNTRGKALILEPNGGIGAQIVRHNCEPYVTVYREQKARLQTERGAEQANEIENRLGSTNGKGREAECSTEIEIYPGLRPFQVDRLARKIAAKAFLGDMLVAWKTVC